MAIQRKETVVYVTERGFEYPTYAEAEKAEQREKLGTLIKLHGSFSNDHAVIAFIMANAEEIVEIFDFLAER